MHIANVDFKILQTDIFLRSYQIYDNSGSVLNHFILVLLINVPYTYSVLITTKKYDFTFTCECEIEKFSNIDRTATLPLHLKVQCQQQNQGHLCILTLLKCHSLQTLQLECKFGNCTQSLSGLRSATLLKIQSLMRSNHTGNQSARQKNIRHLE